MSCYAPPDVIEAAEFARVPDRLNKSGQLSTWIDANPPGSRLGSFLEGPAFDRAGNLYVVDIPFGRILRFTPRGDCDVAGEYDGWPNGLAIHTTDAYSPPGCRPRACNSFLTFATGRMMKRASWQGTVIAESDCCEVVEGNQYFPVAAVKREFLRDSTTHTVCGWKGTASYYDVVVNAETNKDAAWYYPDAESP